MQIYTHNHDYNKIADILNITEEISQRISWIGNQYGINFDDTFKIGIYGAGLSGVLAWYGARYRHSVPWIMDSNPALVGGMLLESNIIDSNSNTGNVDAILVAASPVHYPDIINKVRFLKGGTEIPILTLWDRQGDGTKPAFNEQDSTYGLNIHYGYFSMLINTAKALVAWYPDPDQREHEATALYGAGLSSILAYNVLFFFADRLGQAYLNQPICAVFDSNPALQGKKIYSTQVLSKEQMGKTHFDRLIIGLSPSHFQSLPQVLEKSNKPDLTVDVLFAGETHLQKAKRPKLGDYEMLRGLGAGAEGTCYLMSHATGQDAVLKVFHKSASTGSLAGLKAVSRKQDGKTMPMLPEFDLDTNDSDAVQRVWAYTNAGIPIPDYFISDPDMQKYLTISYLTFQSKLVDRFKVIYFEPILPGNYCLDSKRQVKVTDLGSGFQLLENIPPIKAQLITIRAILALFPEIISIKSKLLKLECSLLESCLQEIRSIFNARKSKMPQWAIDVFENILDLPPQAFVQASTYKNLCELIDSPGPRLQELLCSLTSKYPYEDIPLGMIIKHDEFSWHKESFYQEYLYRKYAVFPLGTTAQKLKELLVLDSNPFINKTYLDIGVNSGFFPIYAALNGAVRAEGIDLAPQVIRKCRKIAGLVGVGEKTTFRQLTWPDFRIDTMDVVSAFSIIHHFFYKSKEFQSLHEIVSALAEATRQTLFVQFVHNEEGNSVDYPTKDPDYSEEIFRDAMHAVFNKVKWAYPEQEYRSRRLYMGVKN